MCVYVCARCLCIVLLIKLLLTGITLGKFLMINDSYNVYNSYTVYNSYNVYNNTLDTIYVHIPLMIGGGSTIQ